MKYFYLIEVKGKTKEITPDEMYAYTAEEKRRIKIIAYLRKAEGTL